MNNVYCLQIIKRYLSNCDGPFGCCFDCKQGILFKFELKIEKCSYAERSEVSIDVELLRNKNLIMKRAKSGRNQLCVRTVSNLIQKLYFV